MIDFDDAAASGNSQDTAPAPLSESAKPSGDPKKAVRVKSVLNKTFRLLKYIITGFVALSLFFVLIFAVVPPPVTPLMIIRSFQKAGEKGNRTDKEWVPIEDISPHLIDAVVASEDNLFLSHFGVDRKAISEALEHNKTSSRTRGASTITQQVAKNVFLWPSRTYLRKGLELYYTFLIEVVWSKKRIMEVYLNVIEMGNGIYGAEAAAQRYFGKSASKLTRGEAALIAVSLPNPRQRNPARPSSYMLSRQSVILDLMNKIGNIKFD